MINAGVEWCYPGVYPCITVKDKGGCLVSVLTDESFNVGDLQVAELEKASVKQISSIFTIAPVYNDPIKSFFREVKPGKYDLYISVGKKNGTPVFQLPYNENDGHKRYKMGRIVISTR